MRARRVVLTLAIAAVGGAIAHFLGFPVAWLLGATMAVALASLAGFRADVPNRLRDLAYFFLGIQAGSGVTPDVLNQLALWPASFAIQMAGVLLIVALTYLFLKRGFGWDRETALLASIPGALSFVLAAAGDTRADMTRIVVVQSVRLLLLIGFLTPVLAWLETGTPVARGSATGEDVLLHYAILFAGCAAGAGLGIASRLPGGLILGTLIASAVLHGTQIAPVPLPVWLAVPSLVLLGALVGGRITPEDRAILPKLAPAAFGAFVIGIFAAGLAVLACVSLLGLEVGKVSLAYAPGALEALTVLAYQFDQDPAYVAAHHVVRFLTLAVLVPLFAKRLPRRGHEAAREIAARDSTAAPERDEPRP